MKFLSSIYILSIALISLQLSEAKLNLDDYAVSDELSLGNFFVQVKPEKYLRIESPVNGEIQILKRGGFYKKGTIWSEVEPERLTLESESYNLAKTNFLSKQKPTVLLDIAESRASLEGRRDELVRNASMIGEIQKDAELAELYLGSKQNNPEGSAKRLVVMQNRINQQLALINQALEYVGTERHKTLETRLAELELEKKELELLRRTRESRQTMPFDGELKYLTQIPDDLSKPLELSSGQQIAEIQKFGRLEVEMVVSQLSIKQLPVHSLSVVLSYGANRSLKASFLRKQAKEVYGKLETVYIFNFQKKDAVVARSLIGGRTQAELVYQLPKNSSIVPKLDLIKSSPDMMRKFGWLQGTRTAFPNWNPIAVGQADIAIIKNQ